VRDPWRIVDPLRPTRSDPPKGKIDLASKDFDADWRPTRGCVLRFKACSIEVASTNLARPEDALTGLARCVMALKRAGMASLGTVHARTSDDQSDVKPAGPPAASLACGESIIEFVGVPLDHGALALVRALMAAGRDTKLALILRANGVTPMMRTT
jgi:hypothetical protein